jgi:kynurenine formamidase
VSDTETRCSDEEVAGFVEKLSNWGRWGEDDEFGTLNLITPEKIAAAASLVTAGINLSLSHDLAVRQAPNNPRPAVHLMQYMGTNPSGAVDFLGIACHGYATTHIDALCHEWHHGTMYNGFSIAEHVRASGSRKCAVDMMRDGIVTRGVLLDIARSQGRPWLDVGERVHVEDLEQAEELEGVTVEPGDALILRVGQWPRMEREGIENPLAKDFLRNGIDADCLPWIRERGVAVYSGDCIERIPSGYPSTRMPLHQIGIAAMGLVLVDNLAVEGLSERCDELKRWEFLFMCSPLRLRHGTGTAVNPLAVF